MDRVSKCTAQTPDTKGTPEGCKIHATFYQKSTTEEGKCYSNQGGGLGNPNPMRSTHSEIEAILEAIERDHQTDITIWNDMIPCPACAVGILALLEENPTVSLTVMFGKFNKIKINRYCYIENLCGVDVSALTLLGGSCQRGTFVAS